MIPAPRPNRDDEADYQAVSNRRAPKTRAALLQATPQVNDAYRRYKADFESYQSAMQASPQLLTNGLRSNFDMLDRGKSFSHIRDDLLAAMTGKCPLCALGAPATLDHYLPRKYFPELSILSLNLVPCCEKCNRLKKDEVRSKRGARFLHAYFDTLPHEEILFAKIGLNGELAISYSVSPNPSVPEATFRNVEYQFKTLELGRYYEREATNEFFDRVEDFYMYFAAGGRTELESYLTSAYMGCLKHWGPNYWRTAFFAGLMRSERFCAGGFQLIVQDLP